MIAPEAGRSWLYTSKLKVPGQLIGFSTATVKTHLIHIYNKLGVDGRTAAVTTALERGIITL